MGWARALAALGAAVAAGALLVSGGSAADPRTPAGLPGLPPPFLGVAVLGGGRLTAAVDAYGDVVDLRPAPAGRALIENPSGRQAAGTVPAGTGIVPWVSLGRRRARPLWTADSVRQHYRLGNDVLVTTARFGSARVRIVYAAGGSLLSCLTQATAGARVSMRVSEPAAARRLRCDGGAARRAVRTAERRDRRWLAGATRLGGSAPRWARSLYRRSLLVLHALTDRRAGAVAAGARDGWSYVWPRDAAAVALALDAAGYRAEARRVARFLAGLDLSAAARFDGNGEPVPGRGPQGDEAGWVAAAARAVGRSRGGLAGASPQLSAETSHGSPAATKASPGWFAETSPGSSPPAKASPRTPPPTKSSDGAPPDSATSHETPPALPDYQEKEPGDYLGNALASHADVSDFMAPIWAMKSDTPLASMVRRAGDPGSGLDSAAAWAVEPFPRPRLYGAARRTMLALVRRSGRFGITPGTAWPGEDPWSAPTAWTAWSLAALARREAGGHSLAAPEAGGAPFACRHATRARANRRAALRLLADLRGAATPTGLLPERVDARTGVPRSTTPLAWSHAFAILALRELWPHR